MSPQAAEQQIVPSPVDAVLERNKPAIYGAGEIGDLTSVKTTLSERSHADVEALRMLIHNAEEAATISGLAMTYMRFIVKRLKELQLRLKIWMSDVDIDSGVLEQAEGQNKTSMGPDLYSVVRTAFQALEVNLNDIGTNVSNMRGHFLQMKEQG